MIRLIFSRVILSSIAVLTGSIGISQWQLCSPNTEFNSILNMSFVNDSTGFLIGAMNVNNIWVYGVFKSNDFAETWTVNTEFSPDTIELFDCSFISNDIGFLSVRLMPQYEAKILKTIDGGLSWNQVSNYFPNPFHEIAFEDENVGYGASGQGDSNIMARTLDGGVNWDWEIIEMMDLYVSDPGEVWMIHGQGIAHTVDFGSNWDIFLMGIDLPRQYWAIAKSGNTLMASGFGLVQGGGTFNVGTIAERYISESQWDIFDFPGTSVVSDVFMINEINAIAVCSTNGGTWPKSLVRTFDGGNTWHYQEYPTINGSNIHLNRVECPSSNVCYAKGYFNILRTFNGGGPSIGLADYTVRTVELEKPKTTFEVFPNPATDVVNVTFSLPLPGAGVLAIIDHTGRQVHSQTLSAGATTAEVDVRALAAGVYLLRVMDGQSPLAVKTFVVE